ncbi:MAG: M6 family metalloprotease domain-containing protein [Candidatus Eisenbacteria bacterium]|nr:M6 family metalloprotease domain-containing protein [Candidatus Eisenbacteria bacterium]
MRGTARATLATFAAIALAFAALPRTAAAINADPRPAQFVQPDGSRITLYLRGDEWLHWQEDAQGYPVVQVNGEWRYARQGGSGELVATDAAVGRSDPRALGLAKGGPRPGPEARAQRLARTNLSRTRPAPAATTPIGVVKNLVILCLFSDQTVENSGRAPSAYDSLFNQVGSTGFNAQSGSVRDYYSQASYGLLTLQSTVLAWVTLPHEQAWYANGGYGFPNAANPYPNNAAGMVHDALALVDGVVNFADFDQNNDGYVDAIDFIHSGYGGEVNGNGNGTIWSHKGNLNNTFGGGEWSSADRNANNVNVKVDLYHTEPARWGTSGPDLVRLGVIAHETGHFFGLPDLYDSDYTSWGIGNYCLMANSWGWDQSQLYPPLPSAWCRIQLGWVVPGGLNTAGTFALQPVEHSPSILRVDLQMPGNEYLLIENRQPEGYDQQIPPGGAGLAIWHIDENVGSNDNEGYPGQSGWPTNGNHFHVALLQADGDYDLEKKVNKGDAGDLWHDVAGIALDQATVPSTNSYSGSFEPSGNELAVVSKINPADSSMTVHYRPAAWVDFSYGGPQNGSFEQPWSSLGNAMALTPADWAVICKGGITGERPTLNKAMMLKSYPTPVLIGP